MNFSEFVNRAFPHCTNLFSAPHYKVYCDEFEWHYKICEWGAETFLDKKKMIFLNELDTNRFLRHLRNVCIERDAKNEANEAGHWGGACQLVLGNVKRARHEMCSKCRDKIATGRPKMKQMKQGTGEGLASWYWGM